MNYYEHHIGDYAEATAHLTFVEDAAYSRMISDISRGKIRNPSFGIGMALLDLARKNHIEVSEREAS